MKSMGRYKCQGTVSTLSVIFLVLCFVIMSYQVSYIIKNFYEIVEKYVICITWLQNPHSIEVK